MLTRMFILFAVICALAAVSVEAGACKPTEYIWTRATGAKGVYNETTDTWSTKYGLSTVNLASIQGSLYYVIAEGINFDESYKGDKCDRKNGMKYINFYKFTICNPDAAMWYFSSQRPDGVGHKEALHNRGFGKYMTMDGGRCNPDENADPNYCQYFHGTNNSPKLGSFIGQQDESSADRNPTDFTYWISAPGACPENPWSTIQDKPDLILKNDTCIEEQPGGECPEGVVPDGEKCTYSYEMMGTVTIDELAGITALENPETGANFTDNVEMCKLYKEGKTDYVEFKSDPKTHEMIEGLPFWKDPLNRTANALRIQKLLDLYKSKENNKALPSTDELKAKAPRCYEAVPDCYDAGAKKETCYRDDALMCVPCGDDASLCPNAKDVDETKAFPELDPVEIPTPAPTPTPTEDPDATETPETTKDSGASTPDATTAAPGSGAAALGPFFGAFAVIMATIAFM